MTYSPTIPGEGLQVTNFDQCLHLVMVIGKCTDVFRGILFCFGVGLRRGGYVGGSFLGGICHGGRKIQCKGRRILWHYYKKTMKNKHENVFSNERKK